MKRNIICFLRRKSTSNDGIPRKHRLKFRRYWWTPEKNRANNSLEHWRTFFHLDILAVTSKSRILAISHSIFLWRLLIPSRQCDTVLLSIALTSTMGCKRGDASGWCLWHTTDAPRTKCHLNPSNCCWTFSPKSTWLNTVTFHRLMVPKDYTSRCIGKGESMLVCLCDHEFRRTNGFLRDMGMSCHVPRGTQNCFVGRSNSIGRDFLICKCSIQRLFGARLNIVVWEGRQLVFSERPAMRHCQYAAACLAALIKERSIYIHKTIVRLFPTRAAAILHHIQQMQVVCNVMKKTQQRTERPSEAVFKTTTWPITSSPAQRTQIHLQLTGLQLFQFQSVPFNILQPFLLIIALRLVFMNPIT